MEEIKYAERELYQKFVILFHDEMKVSSDLVYDKTTGNLVGFMDLDLILSKLRSYEANLSNKRGTEHNLAEHMLVFMVHGLFTTSHTLLQPFQPAT